jgi:hypothetical protein
VPACCDLEIPAAKREAAERRPARGCKGAISLRRVLPDEAAERAVLAVEQMPLKAGADAVFHVGLQVVFNTRRIRFHPMPGRTNVKKQCVERWNGPEAKASIV